MLKTWVKPADIQDVGAYFAVGHAEEELGDWAENSKVSRRGYMEGYQKLADPEKMQETVCDPRNRGPSRL